MLSEYISLFVLLAAVCIALLGILPVRVIGWIPYEPVAVGLTATADIHTGFVGGLTEFFNGDDAERMVAALAVGSSVLTIVVAALWMLKIELPRRLDHRIVIVLVGPVAAAMTSLMSFATTSKLSAKYSYAHALAWGYERNFVEPTVTSLIKSKELAANNFVIYVPRDDGTLWNYLQGVRDRKEEKDWKCKWSEKGYTWEEKTVEVGKQDGKTVSRTVLVVKTSKDSKDKYWVDFPRTLAALTDVIDNSLAECKDRMWNISWLIGRFCNVNEWSKKYVENFDEKLTGLVPADRRLYVCDTRDNDTCFLTIFREMGETPCNMHSEVKKSPPAAEAISAPAMPIVETPVAPLDAPSQPRPAPEAPTPSVVATPEAQAAGTPPPVNPPEKPASKAQASAGAASAVFPSEVFPAHARKKKSGTAHLKTCSDQYHANAATNSNGGLRWKAYLKECEKRLKG